MPVLKKNTFEGQVDGTNANTSNSAASGTAFDFLIPGTGASVKYEADAAIKGGMGLEFIPGSTTTQIRYDAGSDQGRRFVLRRGLVCRATPTADITLSLQRAELPVGSSATLGSALIRNTTRQLRAVIGATPNSASDSPPLTNGEKYFYDLAWTVASASAAGDGAVDFLVYDEDETLIHEWGLINQNFTHFTPSVARFGGLATGQGWASDYLDDIQALWTNDLDALLGPIANVPPTVTISPEVIVISAGQPFAFTATPSDVDGTIVDVDWTVVAAKSNATPSLTGAGTNNVSGTAPAAGTLTTLEVTATDNGGGTATAQCELRVPGTGNRRPLPFPGDGAAGWSIIGGAASEGAALNDGSLTTRVESPDMTATSSVKWWPLAPMDTRTQLRITLTGAVLTAAATGDCRVKVAVGPNHETLITDRALTVTTSDTAPFIDLTLGECAAITSAGGWSRVWVGVDAAVV